MITSLAKNYLNLGIILFPKTFSMHDVTFQKLILIDLLKPVPVFALLYVHKHLNSFPWNSLVGHLKQ